MMSRKVLWLAAALVVGGIVAMLVEPDGHSEDAAGVGTPPPSSDAPAHPASTRPHEDAVANSGSGERSSAAGVAAPAVPAAPSSGGWKLSAEDSMRELFESSDATGGANAVPALHRRFLAEKALDPSWSSNVETQMRAAIEGASPLRDLTVGLVECRTTICEIQATVPPGPAAPATIEQLQNRLWLQTRAPWWPQYGMHDLNTSVAVAQDGSAYLVGYALREAVPKKP